MKLFKNETQCMAFGFFLLALSIGLGAFGAHGLENELSFKSMKTFLTGIRYHQLMSVAWLILCLIQVKYSEINFAKSFLLIFLGILLFSGNCYLYAVTEIKTLAMIIPLGGIFMLYACFLIAWKLFRFKAQKKAV